MGTILITIWTAIDTHLQWPVLLPPWPFEIHSRPPLVINTSAILFFPGPQWVHRGIPLNRIVSPCHHYENYRPHMNRGTSLIRFLLFQHSKICEALVIMTLQQFWGDCALTMNLHALSLGHSAILPMRRFRQEAVLLLIIRTRRLSRSITDISLLTHLNKLDRRITTPPRSSPRIFELLSSSWSSSTSTKKLSSPFPCLKLVASFLWRWLFRDQFNMWAVTGFSSLNRLFPSTFPLPSGGKYSHYGTVDTCCRSNASRSAWSHCLLRELSRPASPAAMVDVLP